MSDSERKKSRHSSSRRSYKSSLFVRNLSTKLKPEDLKKIFGKYAEVKDVYLPIDYKNREPRGFGFIEFYNQEDARDALDKTNGMEIEGNRISVMIAKEGRKTPSEMRTRDRRRRSRSGGRRKKHRRSSSSRSSRSDSRSKKRSSRKKRDRKSSSRSSSASKKSRSRSSSAEGHKKSAKNNTKKSSSRSKDKEENDKRSASKDAKSGSGSKSRSASRSKS